MQTIPDFMLDAAKVEKYKENGITRIFMINPIHDIDVKSVENVYVLIGDKKITVNNLKINGKPYTGSIPFYSNISFDIQNDEFDDYELIVECLNEKIRIIL